MDEERYLYLVDRKNDMIISGGMNVYCVEVENAIRQMRGVQEVAVVGVPHPDWGEAVVAFVILGEDANLGESELSYSCRSFLSAYKRPKEWRIVSDIPLTAYGKADKKALRERAAKEESQG